MYIVLLSYKKEISEVEKFSEAHIQFLNKYYTSKNFIASGRKNPRTGGFILVRNIDKEGLSSIIKEDPFYKNEIANYEIVEVIPTKYDEGFACFVE